jgi:hypothetical protein
MQAWKPLRVRVTPSSDHKKAKKEKEAAKKRPSGDIASEVLNQARLRPHMTRRVMEILQRFLFSFSEETIQA